MPLGSTETVRVDVRILAATNADLRKLVEEGKFREDLYYRLNVINLILPPLRERKEDIPALVEHFFTKYCQENEKFLDSSGQSLLRFEPEAMQILMDHNWPGNVRQLRSTIRRAALLADEVIEGKHWDLVRAPVPGMAFTPKVEGEPWKGLSLREIVQQSTTAVEREVLVHVLKVTGGNKAKAARLLKIDYKTIHEKVKKLGLLTGKNGNDEGLELWNDQKNDMGTKYAVL